MTMHSDDDVCATCGQTWGWHRVHNPVHPFNTGEAGAKAILAGRKDREAKRGGHMAQGGPQGVQWPMDPVLRQALIDKGVLTPEDLVNARAKIEAITGAMLPGGGPTMRGESSGQ